MCCDLYVHMYMLELNNNSSAYWMYIMYMKWPQENLPIVHILCNPGLRQRHWDKMNKIVGFSITPDSGTSLRKMLKYNLEPHFDAFEGQSNNC